jgi:hypothetical protein
MHRNGHRERRKRMKVGGYEVAAMTLVKLDCW